MKTTHELRAMLIPEDDGRFSIISTNLPGVASQGDTREEAIEMLKDSFYGVVACYEEDGEPIPWTQDYEIDEDILTKGSIEVRVLVSVDRRLGKG